MRPNRDRALRQIARANRVTHVVQTMPDGSVHEEHIFPGESFAALAARLNSSEWQERSRRLGVSISAAFGTSAAVSRTNRI